MAGLYLVGAWLVVQVAGTVLPMFEAHASLGLIATEELDVDRAVSELERTVQLNPNYATAHHWLALARTSLGQVDRAIGEGKRALKLDPLSMIINADLSVIYLYARRYDAAETQARKALEIDSRSFLAHYYLGMALQLKGQLKEAIPELRSRYWMLERSPITSTTGKERLPN
jgi:tetratricopeptide (TPR) repeat protein